MAPAPVQCAEPCKRATNAKKKDTQSATERVKSSDVNIGIKSGIDPANLVFLDETGVLGLTELMLVPAWQ